MATDILLRLQHKEYPRNKELWCKNKDGQVCVRSYCPSNHLLYEEHIMSPLQALRQYALMTSDVEGWFVSDWRNWHNFVDKIVIEEPGSSNLEITPGMEACFEFNVGLVGWGETLEEAWEAAKEGADLDHISAEDAHPSIIEERELGGEENE